MKKTNPWTYIKMLPIVLYPYYYMICIVILLIISSLQENNVINIEGKTDPIYFGIIIFGISITFISFGLGIYHSIRSALCHYNELTSSRINMLIKTIQIPAYIITFMVGCVGVLMSIWGIGVVFFAICVDLFTIIITGTAAIGSSIDLFRRKKIPLWLMICFLILNYIYCVDVAVAITGFIMDKVKKEKLVESCE